MASQPESGKEADDESNKDPVIDKAVALLAESWAKKYKNETAKSQLIMEDGMADDDNLEKVGVYVEKAERRVRKYDAED